MQRARHPVDSFAADLGHGLLADGGTVQFLDEPTETWFRTNFRPEGDKLARFIERLLPLAETSPYVAASLPQLLWEAERVDLLVDLALNDRSLPREGDLEQRGIAQQRAQYALKATLRAARDFEAARLALKAGSLAAGHSRRRDLLRRNTDLAGQFLNARTLEDLVATRALAEDWPGSNLHYEGAVLSAAAGQHGIARSRLRSAADGSVRGRSNRMRIARLSGFRPLTSPRSDSACSTLTAPRRARATWAAGGPNASATTPDVSTTSRSSETLPAV